MVRIMDDKTNTDDMRGHNLPKREVHEDFLKKLLVIENDKQSQLARNRAGMKTFKDDAEEVYKSAKLAGVSVKALKHAFKVENFLRKNVGGDAANRVDNDILDEAKAIMEQVEMFSPDALGVYPNEEAAKEGTKDAEAEKLEKAKAADAAEFDKMEKAKAKKDNKKAGK